MKKMKRKLIFVLFAVFTFVLVGCNFNGCVDDPPTGEKMDYTYEYYEAQTLVKSMGTSESSNCFHYVKPIDVKAIFTQEKMDEGMMGVDMSVDALTEVVYVELSVVDTLAPNKFVLQVAFRTDVPLQINTISMIFYYKIGAVTFDDSVTINKKFYQHQLDPTLDSIGSTVYNGDADYPPLGEEYKSIRYSWFALDQNLRFTDEFILMVIVEIHESTRIAFSEEPGWLEFTDWYTQPYPLEVQNIKFLNVTE